ncbi:glycosyltransferase family 4 protein [Terricaulis silvestris]|nr:glycosyltransferase family 4 protein [Terricaulis silvestris]
MQEGHILSVLQVTPELNAGGVERTTLEMAEAISRAGGLALIASAGGRLEPDLEASAGELIRLPVQTKNPITAIHNAWRLARVIKERGVNIVHARSRAPAWSAYLAARLSGVPFVTTFHGIYNARSALKRFYNSVMARGDIVIANSEYTREHVLENYAEAKPDRIVTIPRGVDLAVFNPDRISNDDIAAIRALWRVPPGGKEIVLIAPARLTRWKGQLVLIEAMAMLQKRRPGAAKLIFAGDAQGRQSYVEDMTSAIEQAGLRDVVAIAGHLRQMPEAFAASDIALFPVIEPEAFGRGAVEAQAMGVPVIASNLGGFTETVIENETGFLTPPGVAAALAVMIERMIDLGAEKRVEMGGKGRARVQKLYSKTALQTATLAVYQRLLDEADDRRSANARGAPVL